MISSFEADVKYRQNPTLISQFFALSNIEKYLQRYSFWKCGALFLAIVATFGSLITRIKLIFIYLRRIKPSTQPIVQYLSEDFDFSDDDADECSSASSNDEDLISAVDRDFTVAGQKSNLRLRRRRSSYELFPLSEFVAGKSVVKLWDPVPSPSPLTVTAMVFWSELRDAKNGTVLAAYDTRMKRQFPAICAEWGTGKVVGNGGERVYVRDEVAGVVKVGDMRKAKTLVETVKVTVTVTELDGDMW